MVIFSFKDIKFEDERDNVRCVFLKYFEFWLQKKDLDSIGSFYVEDQDLVFPDVSEKKASKFNFLLSEGFSRLKSMITNNPTTYIHQNSGIPLIGNNIFGIVDKDTDFVEIKPLTGCDLNCIFCSVGEGISNKKKHDFVIEEQYIINEFGKLLNLKKDRLNIFINPQGEPLLYADIVDLVKDLRSLDRVGEIIIVTSGVLLTEELINNLYDAGLSSLHVSLNSLDPLQSKRIAGTSKYDVGHVKNMILLAKDKFKVMLTPVFMPDINRGDVEEIILFAKDNNLGLGIQNFLENPGGRNPTKSWPWEKFYDWLGELEKKYDVELIRKAGFKVIKSLERPFKTNDIIQAEIVCPGRTGSEKIAVAKDRNILVRGCNKDSGLIRLRIKRSKYNIFIGYPI